jgi:hypothetical protein
VLGPAEELLGVAILHALAAIHHQDGVRQLGDHAQVVGDDDDRGVELVLQIADQVEDLRLDGHVERGGRLVGDQQLRVADQRHGDHGALPHPAGELVRVVVDPALGLRDADPAQHVDRPLAGHLLRDVVVHPVRLDDLGADGEVRVHRGQRVLEDHRHLLAAQLAYLFGVGPDQLLAVEPHLTGQPGVVGAPVQAQDAQAGHALAGAGFADDAQRLAALQTERDPVDRPDQAVFGREVHPQVPYVQERPLVVGPGPDLGHIVRADYADGHALASVIT